MKKIAAALILSAALAGCGSSTADSPPTTTLDTYREAEEALEEATRENAQTTSTTLAIDPAQSCDQIGHPYPAKPGDPHDADQDGVACDEE